MRVIPRLALFDETGLTKSHIKSLRLIIWSIAFGMICFNITGGIAMTSYLKSLGISDFLFGVIMAVTPAAGTLQILASYVLERTRKRKQMILIGGLIQRMCWLPFGLIPFFIPMSAPMLRIWMAALLLLVTAVCGQITAISYSSLLADIIPLNIRGRYLGMRGLVSTVMGILGGFLTAWLLEKFPGFNGYALVFGLAALFGTLDISMFFAIEFPPMAVVEKKDRIGHMLKEVLKNGQFMKLTVFFTLWAFALSLSTPFYLVYIRVSLGMGNAIITMIAQILPNICTVIVMSLWGRMLDRRGIRHVTFKVGRWFSVTLLIWVFVRPGPLCYILTAVAFLARGLLLSGIEISSLNAMLNRAPEKNRSMYMAIYSCATTLIGTALANIVGGWLLDNPLASLETVLTPLFGTFFSRYNYLFLISFILAAFSAYILLPKMLEPDNA